MDYQNRLFIYEEKKKQIEKTATTPEEYEKRIKALAERLKI